MVDLSVLAVLFLAVIRARHHQADRPRETLGRPQQFAVERGDASAFAVPAVGDVHGFDAHARCPPNMPRSTAGRRRRSSRRRPDPAPASSRPLRMRSQLTSSDPTLTAIDTISDDVGGVAGGERQEFEGVRGARQQEGYAQPRQPGRTCAAKCLEQRFPESADGQAKQQLNPHAAHGARPTQRGRRKQHRAEQRAEQGGLPIPIAHESLPRVGDHTARGGADALRFKHPCARGHSSRRPARRRDPRKSAPPGDGPRRPFRAAAHGRGPAPRLSRRTGYRSKPRSR